MALVICERRGKPKRRTLRYVRSEKPVGWPASAAVCGLSGCERSGLLWLTDVESRLKNIWFGNGYLIKARAYRTAVENLETWAG